ncbi:MAG: NAD-dependent epimerase/dehydratase family protein [bacterium]
MIAFITGGSGFIGSTLAEAVLAAGGEVQCLVRSPHALKWLQGLPVQLVHGDLFSEKALAQALATATHVFHLAGLTKALTSEEYFRANDVATHTLLKSCAQHAHRLKRFVYVSSIAAAGPSLGGEPVREEEAPHPISIYGRSKLAGETACSEFMARLPIVIVRPPVVYGPRDRDVYEYFKQVKWGIRLRLGFTPRYTSLIHVHDLVRGLTIAAQHPQAVGEKFFLANAEFYEWSQLGVAIAKAMQRGTVALPIPVGVTPAVAAVSTVVAKITHKPALLNFDKVREMRATHWICSAEKARERLGFTTILSLEEGLRQTVKWYREQSWL